MPVPGSEHKSILSQRWPLSIDQICRPPPVGCSLQPPLQSSTLGLPDSPRQTWISQHRWRRALQNSRHKWMSSSPECLKCSQSASFSQVCPVYTMIPVNWGFDNIKTKEILPLPFMPLCLHFLTLPQLSLVEHTSFFFSIFSPTNLHLDHKTDGTCSQESSSSCRCYLSSLFFTFGHGLQKACLGCLDHLGSCS